VSPSVDLFWSFRSPYSYLALPKITRMVAQYDVDVRLRPVYPLAVRVPDFFRRTNPKFLGYVRVDARRVAEMEGIPFLAPRPDPIAQDLRTLEIAAEQPRIRRLTQLGAAAQLAGRSLQFAAEVSRVIWDGSVDGWDKGDHLAKAAARAGFDLAELDHAIAADTGRYEAVISENEAAHEASGHWGVPTFVFEHEPFFGQDRIDALLWRLKKRGLKTRAGSAPP
jgi:2-hydroxychromene-2-carboxylate isomerase